MVRTLSIPTDKKATLGRLSRRPALSASRRSTPFLGRPARQAEGGEGMSAGA